MHCQLEGGPDLAEPWECVAFSGVLLSERRFYIGGGNNTPDGLTVEEAVHANGEWLAVFQNVFKQGEYLVLTDSFGFQPAFYSVDPHHGFMVGTSAEGIGGLKNDLAIGSEIDDAQLCLTLCTNHSWSSTLNSEYTGVVGLKTMRSFEYIWIVDDQFDFKRIDGLMDDLPSDYEGLLEHGIASAKKQLKVLSEIDVSDRRINLSGGKDSRLMMAMLSSADLATKFSVRSVNPKTWADKNARDGLMRDLLIADSLRRHFGMEWSKEGERVSTPLLPMESLTLWQKFRGSKNYKFRIQRKQVLRVKPIVELRGASGECFRRFWSYYFRELPNFEKFGDVPESFESDMELLFDDLYPRKMVSEELRLQALEKFKEALKSTGRATLSEASDRHFSLYRNRGHFGTTLAFIQEGAVPFFPLNQLAFVRAGELLSVNDRIDGAVFFDLIERMDPALNDLEFDSQQWPSRFWNRAGRSQNVGFLPTDAQCVGLNEYFQNERSNTEALKNAQIVREDTAQVFGDKMFAYSMIRDLLDELGQIPGGEFLTDSRLRSWLLSLPEVNLGYALQQVSKLMSIWRILTATIPVNLNTFGGNTLKQFGTPSNQIDRFVPHPAPKTFKLRSHLEPLLFRVAVKESEGKVEAKILIDQARDFDLEYAFYLKVDGKVADSIDYSHSLGVEFEKPLAGKEYWVQAFVRKTRGSRAPYILHSVKFPID